MGRNPRGSRMEALSTRLAQTQFVIVLVLLLLIDPPAGSSITSLSANGHFPPVDLS